MVDNYFTDTNLPHVPLDPEQQSYMDSIKQEIRDASKPLLVSLYSQNEGKRLKNGKD